MKHGSCIMYAPGQQQEMAGGPGKSPEPPKGSPNGERTTGGGMSAGYTVYIFNNSLSRPYCRDIMANGVSGFPHCRFRAPPPQPDPTGCVEAGPVIRV